MLACLKKISSRPQTTSVLVLQVAVGMYLISSGVVGGLLSVVNQIDPHHVGFEAYMGVQIMLGILLLAGLFIRVASIALLGMFGALLVENGISSFDQIMILGVGLALFFKGGTKYSLDHRLFGNTRISHMLSEKLDRFAQDRVFLQFIGVAFGANLIWLGLVEKLFSPDMFAAVLENFQISPPGMTPELVVFGAGIVELMIGGLYMLRIRMRLTSSLMFFVLIFTVVTFQESVIAHIMMFAISAIFIINSNDPVTVIPMNTLSPYIRRAKNILLLRMYAD